MLTRGQFRALACGLLVISPLVAVAGPYALPDDPATPLTGALVAAQRRNAAPVPFDLTYLPTIPGRNNGPRAVVAVRPCALFDRPGGNRLARATLLDSGTVDAVKELFNLSAMELPEVAALDMILTCIPMEITPAAEPGHGSFKAFTTCAVLRTRAGHNWLNAFRRVPQPLARATHRGREYRTFAVDVTRANPQWMNGPINVALFIPDDRTLVIGSETEVKAVLDRLADGTPAPEPAGWAKVRHGVIAVAVDVADKKWTRHLPGSEGPRLPNGGDWEWNVLDDLDELVVGLDDRPTTRFQLTATARDPFAGKRMAWNAKRLLSLAEAHLEGETQPIATAVRTMWAIGRFTPTLRGFEITADAGVDLIGPFLDRLTPPAPIAAPPAGP